MKTALLSLYALAFVFLSNSALAKDDDELVDTKNAKVFYRCDSAKFEFSDSAQMKEVSPGRFVWESPAQSTLTNDKCVVSIVDSSISDELCFVDFVISGSSALVDKTYAMRNVVDNSSFKVEYSVAGAHSVEFDMKSKKLSVKTLTKAPASKVVVAN